MENNTVIIPEPEHAHLVILGNEYEVVHIFSIELNNKLKRLKNELDIL